MFPESKVELTKILVFILLVYPPVAQQRAGVKVPYSIIKVQNGDNHTANTD